MNNVWFGLAIIYIAIGSFMAGKVSEHFDDTGDFFDGFRQGILSFGVALIYPVLMIADLFILLWNRVNRIYNISFFFKFYILRRKFTELQINRAKEIISHYQKNTIRDRIWRKCAYLAIKRYEKEANERQLKIFLFLKINKNNCS